MIISAEELPDTSSLSAHLAVVGAGPAGIVVALEAAKNGFDVLLIESGYDKFSSRVQQLSEAASLDPGLHAPMSMAARRQLGGTSVIWGGRCVPYDRVDFDRRHHIIDTTWPVTYDELAPYFQRACDWLRCGRAVFNAAQIPHLRPSIVPGLPNGAVGTTTLERWSLSTDFAREYGNELRRSTRVRVVTGLNCVEVISSEDNSRADHLACRTLDGKRVSVQARSYVLACGGLESTRLLLASRGPRRAPLGDHSGHLGSWYMGHVGGVIARVRFCTPPGDTIFGYERDVDGTHVRRRFSIERNAQLDQELPNVIAFLANPELADYRHQNGVLSFAHLTLRSPVGQLISPAAQRVTVTGEKGTGSAANLASQAPMRPHLANVARDWTSVARFAAGFGARRFLARGRKIPGFFAAYSADNLYPLQYHGEHIPSRQSRVSLASERDAVGMQKLNIDLRFSKKDVDGILRCHQIWDNHLRQSGRGYLEYMSSDPGSLVWENMGGGTHQLGMTRMAARAEEGVVGRSLAVHGISNLFVASSSVFSTSGQANPTFMIVVFALRLSDHLRSNLAAL